VDLARRDSKILAHAGARGTAWWNVTMLDGKGPEALAVRLRAFAGELDGAPIGELLTGRIAR